MGVYVDQRRNKGLIDLEEPRFRAQDAGKGKRHRAFAVLAFGQDLQVFAGHLHRLFAAAGVLVADQQHLRQKARADLPTPE